MVSSAVCTTMSPKANTRVLNIDRSKDYSLPLQVETSVEYDLPSHIYPPKGSDPILMIHPSFATPVRARKVTVTPQSHSVLSSLQVHDNHQLQTRRTPVSKPKFSCVCGYPNCNINSRTHNNRGLQLQQQSSVLSSRQVSSSHLIKNNLYSAVKSNMQSTDLKSQQKQLQQKAQIHKQIQQVQHQKQLQLQQQHLQQVQLQKQFQERVKLQAQQIQQLKSTRQQSSGDNLISWGVAGRCQAPCCQPRIGALAPSQAEFLAPGLPPSLLARTPKGPSGGSPKVRTRARRGINTAHTVNLPDYMGSARSSRTSSVAGAVGGSSHSHTRTRSSSMLAATPAPITAHQVASALDVVRAHVLTPRSLFSSSQHHLSSTPTFLSTVGQSRDSGCSLTTEIIPTSTNGSISGNENVTGKNVEWSWSVVDSGFCTPVDTNEDQLMETYDANGAATATLTSYTPVNCSSSVQQESSKDSCNSNLRWMREFSTPLSSGSSLNSIHHSFLPSSTPHYIPQPIWNLAY